MPPITAAPSVQLSATMWVSPIDRPPKRAIRSQRGQLPASDVVSPDWVERHHRSGGHPHRPWCPPRAKPVSPPPVSCHEVVAGHDALRRFQPRVDAGTRPAGSPADGRRLLTRPRPTTRRSPAVTREQQHDLAAPIERGCRHRDASHTVRHDGAPSGTTSRCDDRTSLTADRHRWPWPGRTPGGVAHRHTGPHLGSHRAVDHHDRSPALDDRDVATLVGAVDGVPVVPEHVEVVRAGWP